MRRVALGLMIVGSFTALAWAGGDDARAIIERAIKATGGEENLTKYPAETYSEKGTYYGMGQGLPYTGKYAVHWPNRSRMEIENVFTKCVDGDRGWIAGGFGSKDLTAEEMKQEKNNQYGGWVATLLPLKDKSFTLTALPETKVEGKPAIPVKVTKKDRPEVMLYFDKDNQLLVKSEQMVVNEAGKSVKMEAILSAYKESGGRQTPTKVIVRQDGKLFVEAELFDHKVHEKLDDKIFAKPGT